MPTIQRNITTDPLILPPITGVTAAVEQDVQFVKTQTGMCSVFLRPESGMLVKFASGGPQIKVPAGSRVEIPISQDSTTLWLQGDGADIPSITTSVGIEVTPSGAGNVNPAVTMAPAQMTSANGLLGNNLLTGDGTWFDAAAFQGRMVSLLIATSAGLAGGNLAFEQTNDTTLDPNGGSWQLQDSTTLTQSAGASLTTAASNNYRRMGVITSRYIRLRLTSAITAGTIDTRMLMSHVPFSNVVLSINQATGSSLNTQSTGAAAHSSAATGNPLQVGGRVFNTLDITLASGDAAALLVDTSGRTVVNAEAPPELKFVYRTGGTGFSATADTAAAAAAGASIRRRPRRIRLCNTGVAGALIIKDGATEIDRIVLPASMTQSVEYVLDCRTSANAALNIACSVASMAIIISMDGHNEF